MFTRHLYRDRVYLKDETFQVLCHSQKQNGNEIYWAISPKHAFEYETSEYRPDHTKIVQQIVDDLENDRPK